MKVFDSIRFYSIRRQQREARAANGSISILCILNASSFPFSFSTFFNLIFSYLLLSYLHLHLLPFYCFFFLILSRILFCFFFHLHSPMFIFFISCCNFCTFLRFLYRSTSLPISSLLFSSHLYFYFFCYRFTYGVRNN